MASAVDNEERLDLRSSEGDCVLCSVTEAEVSLDEMLSLACRQGKRDIVELLLMSGAHVNHRNKAGNTPLLEACSQGHVVVARLLLMKNALIDAPTESTSDSALTWACTLGNDRIVELLLSRGANVEHRTKDGCTALMFAALAGHVHVAELLLDHGAEINVQSESNKDSPLTFACWKGHSDVVDLLLNRQADIEHRTKEGFTPLMFAALGGHTDVAKLLLERDAKVNVPSGSNNDIPLTSACWKGHHPVVKLLLEYKSDLEHRTKDGCTPLMLAAREGHLSVAMLILEYGAELNVPSGSENNIPLTLACWKGHCEVVDLLLHHDSDLEHHNKAGCTPLMLAAREGHVEATELLLEHGAEINVPSGSNDDTPLTLASWKGHAEVVELLLSNKSNVDHQTKTGCTPLMEATREGHALVAQLLLEYGAEVETPDNYGQSPLFMACWKGHARVARLLLELNANRDCRTKTGITPLFQACRENHLEVVRLLLEYGCSVNAPFPNSSRENPLTLASEKGHTELVKLLLERGGNVEVRTKKGATPFLLSCREGHLNIGHMLFSKGACTEIVDSRHTTPLIAAFRQGHVSTVEWLLKYVKAFPSDDECQKAIAAPVPPDCKQPEMLELRKRCLALIMEAKAKKKEKAEECAQELFNELDAEKAQLENRRLAHARKREKRKVRKREQLDQARREEEARALEHAQKVQQLEEEKRQQQENTVTTASASSTVPPPAPITSKPASAGQTSSQPGTSSTTQSSSDRGGQQATPDMSTRGQATPATADVAAQPGATGKVSETTAALAAAKVGDESSRNRKKHRNRRKKNNTAPASESDIGGASPGVVSGVAHLQSALNASAAAKPTRTVNMLTLAVSAENQAAKALHSRVTVRTSAETSYYQVTAMSNSARLSSSSDSIVVSSGRQAVGRTPTQSIAVSSIRSSSGLSTSSQSVADSLSGDNTSRDVVAEGGLDWYHDLSDGIHETQRAKTSAVDHQQPQATARWQEVTNARSSNRSREQAPTAPSSTSASSQSAYALRAPQVPASGTGTSGLRHMSINVPNQLVGRIIGKGGLKINTITEQSGAQINVARPQPRANERVVTMKGTNAQLDKAKELIQEALDCDDADLSATMSAVMMDTEADPKPPKVSPQLHTDAAKPAGQVEAGRPSVQPTAAVSNPAGGNKSGIGTTQPKAVSSHMIPVRSHVPSSSVSFADMASGRAAAHGKPAADVGQPPQVANPAPSSGSLPHDQCSSPPGHQQLTGNLCVNVSSATPTATTTTPTHCVTCVASSKAVVSVPDGTASGSSELTTSSVATPATVASIASTSAGDSESPSKATTPTQSVTPVASPSVVVPTPVNTRASARTISSVLPVSSASSQSMGASPGTNVSVSTATTGPPPTTMATLVAPQQEPEVQLPIAASEVLPIGPASNPPRSSFQDLPSTSITHTSLNHMSIAQKPMPIPYNSPATSVSGPAPFGAIGQLSAGVAHGAYTSTSAGEISHPEPSLCQASASSVSQPGKADEPAFSARPPELQEAQVTVGSHQALRDHLQSQLPQHHPQGSYVPPFFVAGNSCWSANTSGTHSDTNPPVSRVPGPPGFPAQHVAAGSGANSVRQAPQSPWLKHDGAEWEKSSDDILSSRAGAPGQPKMMHSEQPPTVSHATSVTLPVAMMNPSYSGLQVISSDGHRSNPMSSGGGGTLLHQTPVQQHQQLHHHQQRQQQHQNQNQNQHQQQLQLQLQQQQQQQQQQQHIAGSYYTQQPHHHLQVSQPQQQPQQQQQQQPPPPIGSIGPTALSQPQRPSSPALVPGGRRPNTSPASLFPSQAPHQYQQYQQQQQVQQTQQQQRQPAVSSQVQQSHSHSQSQQQQQQQRSNSPHHQFHHMPHPASQPHKATAAQGWSHSGISAPSNAAGPNNYPGVIGRPTPNSLSQAVPAAAVHHSQAVPAAAVHHSMQMQGGRVMQPITPNQQVLQGVSSAPSRSSMGPGQGPIGPTQGQFTHHPGGPYYPLAQPTRQQVSAQQQQQQPPPQPQPPPPQQQQQQQQQQQSQQQVSQQQGTNPTRRFTGPGAPNW